MGDATFVLRDVLYKQQKPCQTPQISNPTTAILLSKTHFPTLQDLSLQKPKNTNSYTWRLSTCPSVCRSDICPSERRDSCLFNETYIILLETSMNPCQSCESWTWQISKVGIHAIQEKLYVSNRECMRDRNLNPSKIVRWIIYISYMRSLSPNHSLSTRPPAYPGSH